MQSVLASPSFPLNTSADIYSPRQHLKPANDIERPGFNNTSIHHRQTRPVQLAKINYSSDSTQNDLEIMYSDREMCPLKKKGAKKPKRQKKPNRVQRSGRAQKTHKSATNTDTEKATSPAKPPSTFMQTNKVERKCGITTDRKATTDTDNNTSTLDSWYSAAESIHPCHTSAQNTHPNQPLTAPPLEYPVEDTQPLDDGYLEAQSVNRSTVDAPTEPVALAVDETEGAKAPIEAESTYWQSTATYILSGMNKLVKTVLPTPVKDLEGIDLDMQCFREEHDDGLYFELPIDVDAIDSDLNSKGQPTSGVQPQKESSGTPYESEENDYKTEETSQRKHSVNNWKHQSPSELPEIYKESLPVVKLSTQAYGDPSSISIDVRDDQPELLISLYPHGILQLLLILFPETAIKIIKSRLDKLSSTSMDTFEKLQKSWMQNRTKFRDTLTTNLAVLRESLNDLERDVHNARYQLAILKNLRKFEHQYNVYSLESKMDADFLVQKGRISSELLATSLEKIEGNQLKDPKLLKPTTWFRKFGYQCKEREFILRGAMWGLAKYQMEKSAQSVLTELIKHPPVRVPVSGTDTCRRNTVNQYIQEQPETVIKVLTYLVCLNVKRHRYIRNIKAAKLALTACQQTHTAESAQAFIDRLTSQTLMPEIAKQLEDEIGWLHGERLDHELESTQAEARLPDLLDQRQHIRNLKLLKPEKAKSILGNQPSPLVSGEREVSARLIHHFLATQSSPREADLFPQCLFLEPPAADHIFAVLSQSSNTPEKSFYLATLQFIDAMNHSKQDASYDSDLHWMQCHYDMNYHQQQLFIYLMDKAEPSQLLPFDKFEQNIEALLRLAKARKQTGLRPLNPDSYTYSLSYLNFVWQEEENIEDIIAELYRKRYLRLLNYAPYTEFLSLFSDVFDLGDKARRAITTKAGLLINAFKKSGFSNAFDYLCQEGKGVISSLFSYGSPIYTRIINTLSTMLKVAKQNPKFFRVMCGDFALLIPRLKSLLGYDTSVTGLLENISLCIRGQALASMFSGDKPEQLDVDPLRNPEIATVFRRYQLLRDMISISEIGLPIAEIFQGISWNTIKEKAQKFLLNLSSTYLAKQCINPMKPPIIRLCNNLLYARDLMPSLTLGLKPDFLASMVPEETVRLAHHIGRRTGIAGGIVSYLLDPLIIRVDKYKEKINNAKANPCSMEARNELTSERKKIAGILGVSSVLSTAAILLVNTFKIIIFISSPWLTTACIGIITFFGSSRFVARRYNELDEVWTSLSETVSEQMKRTFAKNSPKAIEARKRIDEISRANLARMAEHTEQECSSWRIAKKNFRRIKLSKFWNQLPYKNKEKIHQDIKNKIREKHHEMMEEAQYLDHLLKASTLLKSAIKKPEEIVNNMDNHTDFNQQLARLHFKPIGAENFLAELTTQKETITNFLQYTYGTVDLGESIEEIMNTIETYNINLYMGAYLEHRAYIHDLKSAFFHTGMAANEQHVQERPPTEEKDGKGSEASFPDVAALREMMKKADLEFEEQWLERERQVQERMMKTVTSQALLKSLEDRQKHTERSIADVLVTPLYKANLEIQVNALNKTQTADETHPSTQHQDPLLATHGCGYKPREACKALAGG